MRTMKHFALATMAAAALALAGCGGGGGSTANGGPQPPAPMPVAAMGTIMLDDRAQTALMAILPDPGDSDTVDIAAGGTEVREGVTFSCDSAYPCTVTVTNSLGTIVASWESQTLGDGTAGVMASMPPLPVNTFAELNAANSETVHGHIATTPALQPTEVTGMGVGLMGVDDNSMAGLRSLFDPNGAAFGAAPGDTAATPGATPTLTGGSTLSADMTDGDGIMPSMDMAMAPDGWNMHALFRDWGDTAGANDGGYETGAIMVENLEDPVMHAWDAMLSGRFVNNFTVPGVTLAAGVTNNPYHFTIRRDGVTVDADNPADTVAFQVDTTSDTPGGMGSFVNANAAGAGSLQITVTSADDGAFRAVTGEFLGVSGTFTCGTTDCALSRTVGTDNFTLGTGNWQFTPDPGSMVSVPDQDWMVYGAWLTTPDIMSGPHRVGTFFNGMNVYPAGNANLTTGGLSGSAEYNGGAAGIYVDGEASGLFTATATLTANFDVEGTETANDYMISGRIHDFRGTDGVYLGTDTAADPNDPVAGGENDWVVILGTSTLADIGTNTATSGSADGVQWAGNWSGSFFGPTTDGTDAIAPSGVAGLFSASAPDTDTTADGHQGPNVAVTGAFGATR